MGTRVTFTVHDDNVGPLVSYLKGYLRSTPSVVIESVEDIPEPIVQEFRVVVTRPNHREPRCELTVTEITP